MIFGDRTDWEDYFDQQLVPVVLGYVLTTWEQMPKPGFSEHEDAISNKLYKALLNGKERNGHPFSIHREYMEFDLELGKGIGRIDIVFLPGTKEDIYLAIEAKRLNATISGKKHSLAGEYVNDGMQRYIDGKYARSVKHGVMLAYVLDGKIEQAMSAIENSIKKYHEKLSVRSDVFIASAIRPQDSRTKETHHQRKHEKTIFRLHHLFVA